MTQARAASPEEERPERNPGGGRRRPPDPESPAFVHELPGHLTWREIPSIPNTEILAATPGLHLRLKPWARLDTAGVIWIVMLAHGRLERGLDFRLETLSEEQRAVFELCSPDIARVLEEGWKAGGRPRLRPAPRREAWHPWPRAAHGHAAPRRRRPSTGGV